VKMINLNGTSLSWMSINYYH